MSELGAAEDVVKHVPSTFVEGNWVDGFVFLPRPLPKDHDGSSVHRLHVFSDDDAIAMENVRNVSRLKLRAGHRFAQIEVGSLVECVAEVGIEARVIADPLPANDQFNEDPSHALIVGLPQPGVMDDLIGDLIRRRIKAVHLAIPVN